MALLAMMLLMSVKAQSPQVINLWPNGAPGSESRKDEPVTHPHPWSIANIENPSITVFAPPAGTANGTAIIIAPGGGHTELGVEGEGTSPAKFLNSLGVTAFVLRYRLFREKNAGLTFEKDTKADTFRAIRLVRSRAAEWGVDPNRIGFLGFSAGGENLNLAAFAPSAGDAAASDPIEHEDARPNFAMWIYPGPLGIPDQIPANAPPAFLVCAQDDDHVASILLIAQKYRAAKIPYEMHVLSSGGHGFGMGDRNKLKAVNTWPQRLADWLSDSGWLKKG
jgi:acetyl esterase/lipase